MARIIKSPAKYVQGPGELQNLKEYLQVYGNNVLFIVSEGGLKRSKDSIVEGLEGTDISFSFSVFGGLCTQKEIERHCEAAKLHGAEMVAGIGGGQIIDTAKAVGYYEKIPMVIIPTIASTDAPTSAQSLLYKEDGSFDKLLRLDESPNLIIADTEIILWADTKYLVAGMGDALATSYEARAVRRSGKNNMFGGKPTESSYALAEKCREVILRDGLNAKESSDCGAHTVAFENVVEANTYLSGVGFESSGLAAAHAIQKGLILCPEMEDVYHGVKVAFCTLVQLVLENAPQREIEEVTTFMQSVGLPTTFDDLGLVDVTDEKLMTVAKGSSLPNMTIHNMPFEITPEKVCAALKLADAIGRRYKNKKVRY
jgi:glycerol dehydrogenase